MTIYFLSAQTAALKADGIYLGLLDSFERFFEADLAARHFIEIVPEGALSLSFVLGEEFIAHPPDFADVYTGDGEAVIYIKRFEKRGGALKVAAQKRLSGGGLFTLFSEGGRVYLSYDGENAELYELSDRFSAATLKEDAVGGRPVMIAEGDGCICVLNQDGKRVFYNRAESFSTGATLEIVVPFVTAAGCRAKCTFSYDGEEMKLESSVTEETREVAADVMHFAFFESVLTHGDYKKYLSDGLKDSADAIGGYLGDFVDVVIPHSRFYLKHGDIKAAGLVYPVAANLFRVKYFAVETEEAKIANIYECG